MNEDDLREFELGLDTHGRLSLEDTWRLIREVRRLGGLLLEYGRHSEGCNAQWGDRYRCRCGWREVAAQFIEPAENAAEEAGDGDD